MRIHITAVSGTGMGALAGLLQELGHTVSGSDTAFYPPMGPALERWGIELLEGFRAEHLKRDPPLEAVIIGNVCRKENPEAVAAEQMGLERLHIADALRRFVLPGTSPLVVVGTHGKTTTSSLCAHLLLEAGLSPGFLIGGILQGTERSFRSPGPRRLNLAGTHPGKRRPPFVLEGDEYDTAFWEKTAKFLHYGAEVAVITSVEHDHIDIYPTFESYLEAFCRFARELPPEGLLLAYAGDPHARLVAKSSSAEVAYYGILGDECGDAPVHWLAAPAQTTPQGTTFDLYAGGVFAGRFLCPLSGTHNLRNAVAALAATAQGYGADLRALAEPLARFQGVRRRQELLGQPGGVFIYDDFAHHPTAVSATLSGLRARHPEGKLIAVFEPRSATSCRKLHQEAYASAFDAAQVVLLAPVGRQDLPASERLDVAQLATDLRTRGINAEALDTTGAIIERVNEVARSGDAVAVLSNGAFDGLHQKLLTSLSPG